MSEHGNLNWKWQIIYTSVWSDSEDEDTINNMLSKLNEKYKKLGLSINTEKTEYLVVHGNLRFSS